nr:MAG TPA: hypothetical protein [Caudoviricetes sp.]
MQEKRNIYSKNLCKFFPILQTLERIKSVYTSSTAKQRYIQ